MADTHAAAIASCAAVLVEALRAGHKVLFLGNGGSAADAQHIAAELVGRFGGDRAPLPAIALTVDTSAITAIANDYGYDHVFERQVRALARPGDVVVAITTSGRSKSVLLAVEAARAAGAKVIGLTGSAALVVPTRDTARIQELHITAGHVMCEIVEAELFAMHGPAPAKKALSLAELIVQRECYRAEGRTVVWTNGCFDVLHAGHVHSLRTASRLGDVLIVGVNDDDYVRRVKGEGRPVHGIDQRVDVLSALEFVDHVVVFSEDTPTAILGQLKPDVHCKGADYQGPNAPPIPEAEVVRAYGGRVEFIPLVAGLSSSSIARRL
jgi:rfaE bifunctional protein nucleotidyltransferase chain/domain